MSFAAAICSMFCEGIVPIRVYFSLVCRTERCQTKPEKTRFHQLSSHEQPGLLMRIFLRYILVVISLVAFFRPAQARELIHKGDTVVVPLTGGISPPLLLFLRGAVKAS